MTEMTHPVDRGMLERLADMNGVATSFWDWNGNKVEVASNNLLRVLQALGLPVDPDSDDAAIAQAIRVSEDAPWLQTLPPSTVTRIGDWREIPIHVPHGQPVRAWYTLENGESGDLTQLDRPVEPREVEGELRGRATFEVPGTLPLGYHRVFAEVGEDPAVSAALIVVPQRLSPSVLAGEKRFWGVNAQAYSVLSKNSWGVGDSADLADLIAVVAAQDAQFLLVNPMHAAETVSPTDNSPYRPVSRQWLNVMYIRPEDIPEYGLLPDGDRDAIEALRKASMPVGDDALLARDDTWEAKRQALAMIYEAPRPIRREALFQSFCLDGGEALQNHALWAALCDAEGTTDLPEQYSSPESEAVTQFEETHEDEIDFHKWCQWVASEQLRACNREAKELGMEIGVMADLAVGIHPKGSEAWAHRNIFAPGMYVGAPPDMYAQQGQSWTQPPYNPKKLAEAEYEPLRQVIQTALQLAGALRIDHILGFFRLWWLPADGTPADGTYVYFDHEAMIGVLLLEAHRADAVLIGEDLGTVEPWVREYLGSRGILGTSVFWFEKNDAGELLHTNQWRRDILGTVNTHDLPPTLGYMDGIHTTLRNKLGLLVDPVEVMEEADKKELAQMTARLQEYGLVGDDPTRQDIIDGLHRYVARTPARLVATALVDLVGEKRPQNLPGTEHEYPNWRVPLADAEGKRVWLEDLATNEDYQHLYQVMREEISR